MKKISIRLVKTTFFYALSAAFILIAGMNQADAQQQNTSAITPFLILSFTGQTGADVNELNWTMENETDAQYFVIERSADGNVFDSIGTVTALNNQQQLSYSYTDGHILSGNNYYRLREMDQLGVSRYSKVLILTNTVVSSGSSSGFQVYPNPAVSTLNYTIASTSNDEATVQVYTLSGVMISSQQFQVSVGENTHSITVSNIRSGIYFARITTKQGINVTQTFTKL